MNVEEVSVNVLAYLGDSVMTLIVRDYLVNLGYCKTKELQELSTNYVSANNQSYAVLKMIEADFFTEKELAIFKRGRNFKSNSKAKNADVISYHNATGYEAIWGYLHLVKNTQRIVEMWELNRKIMEERVC
ncbi:MAG: ribonuclease III domain-containing protein [Erysipelotrichaceae bacterium]